MSYEDILEGSATALFATSYPDAVEEVRAGFEGATYGHLVRLFGLDYPQAGAQQDWLDYLPDRPESVDENARKLLRECAKRNPVHSTYRLRDETILIRQAQRWEDAGGQENRHGSVAWNFGFLLTMQALGCGVGLTHSLIDRFEVETPSWEFSIWDI